MHHKSSSHIATFASKTSLRVGLTAWFIIREMAYATTPNESSVNTKPTLIDPNLQFTQAQFM